MPILKKLIATLNSTAGSDQSFTVPAGKILTISTIVVGMKGDPLIETPTGKIDIYFTEASLVGLPPEAEAFLQNGAGVIVPYSDVYNADAKYLTIGLTFREGDVIYFFLDCIDTNSVMTVAVFGMLEDIGSTVKTTCPVQSVTPV